MYTLHLGNSLTVLPTVPSNSIDAIVCDPPYELGFMGKSWDASGIAYNLQLWQEALRVLKPGGHLLAFSGSRTYHRMSCAIEDAGFEIRDQIMWVYGSGFPKSMNLKDEWQGWGTALKPAHEPICVARKPLAKGFTVAANVREHGTGGLNIDGCRVENADYDPNKKQKQQSNRVTWEGGDTSGFRADHEQATYNEKGRWPANLIHDGSDGVVALFPDSKGQLAAVADAQRTKVSTYGEPSDNGKEYEPRGDTGSAARFFYCAKTSKKDRNENNSHPTVKPTDLMRYLCRLVTPPGGTVLDPFMGSGSTGKAAILEGFRFTGIEMSEEYMAIAAARIEAAFETTIADML